MTTAEHSKKVLGLTFRDELAPTDAALIREIVAATGKFTEAEVDVAVELVQEYLARGPESGYWFTVAEHEGQVIGYAAYGLIPCTVASYDLYWIAVHPRLQGSGIGRRILAEVEQRVRRVGGVRIYLDTSGRAAYDDTRAFYERTGYEKEAVLEDFYSPGDAKVIYLKRL